MSAVRWHSLVLPGSHMRRLNVAAFMQLGVSIEGLAEAELGKPLTDEVKRAAFDARDLLKSLMREDEVPLHIPASRREAGFLLQTIDEVVEKLGDAGAMADPIWSYKFYRQATKLRAVLQAELAVQAVYYLWPKRAYDVNLLADRAVSLFSPDLREWFTENELQDIDQAGKCLAFEVGTAAGFHLLRAAESVIRRYYEVVVGTLPTPKMRSWGTYVRTLRKCDADPKVVNAVEQVKEFHRNPVIHPEEQLTVEEALSLLGIIESVISAIYRDMALRAAGDDDLLKILGGSPESPKPSLAELLASTPNEAGEA